MAVPSYLIIGATLPCGSALPHGNARKVAW